MVENSQNQLPTIKVMTFFFFIFHKFNRMRNKKHNLDYLIKNKTTQRTLLWKKWSHWTSHTFLYNDKIHQNQMNTQNINGYNYQWALLTCLSLQLLNMTNKQKHCHYIQLLKMCFFFSIAVYLQQKYCDLVQCGINIIQSVYVCVCIRLVFHSV